MVDLAKQTIETIDDSSKAMSDTEIREFLPNLRGWNLVYKDGEDRLERGFTFPNFTKALDFTNRVGQAADAEDHHPLICTEWGKVTISWWTHKVHGLHLNDFIMAARTDQIYSA